MDKNIRILIIIGVLLLIALLSYFIGYRASFAHLSKDSQTFYARVVEVRDHELLVRGLSVNEEEYRGFIEVSIDRDVLLEEQKKKITLGDFQELDRVVITHAGKITGTNPKKITDTFKVYKLQESEDVS